MALPRDAWDQFAGKHRWNAQQPAALWTLLQQPQLPVPAHVVRAKSRRVVVLVQPLETVVEAVDAYRKVIMDCFASLPPAEWAATLPASQGALVPSLWAELGDAFGRWQSWQHLQGHSGGVPVTRRSGKSQGVAFRFACNGHLRRALQQFAFCSLKSSEWARAYSDRPRGRGHRHPAAVRALAATWVKIIFVLWSRHAPYDEHYHLAMLTRQHLRHAAYAGSTGWPGVPHRYESRVPHDWQDGGRSRFSRDYRFQLLTAHIGSPRTPHIYYVPPAHDAEVWYLSTIVSLQST